MNTLEWVLPSLDATTVAGQFQWFMCGFVYSSVIASTAMMIRLFKSLSKSQPDL